MCSFVAAVDEKKEKNMVAVAAAKTKVRADIQQLSEQLKGCKDEIAKLKQHMLQLEGSGSLPAVSWLSTAANMHCCNRESCCHKSDEMPQWARFWQCRAVSWLEWMTVQLCTSLSRVLAHGSLCRCHHVIPVIQSSWQACCKSEFFRNFWS